MRTTHLVHVKRLESVHGQSERLGVSVRHAVIGHARAAVLRSRKSDLKKYIVVDSEEEHFSYGYRG